MGDVDTNTTYTSLPANGGNADTVDGKHASEFATSAQGTKADNALPKSGGTMTGPLMINGGEKDDGSGQLAMLKALSTNSAGAGTPWLGRAMVGAKNLTFLMGTYNGLAGLGAHSWTDASSGQGAAWAPIYIQPDGGANAALYIGQNGSGWTANSGTLVVKGSSTVNGGSVEVRGTLTATKINGLATVATSGNYNDLSNKPTIPAAYTHPSTHPASMITGGTFAGEVKANSSGETYSTYCLRNTRLASSDTNPTVNGEICWTYA